ncbi:MAG: hypothetical protein ACE5JB_02380 [bacterium]
MKYLTQITIIALLAAFSMGCSSKLKLNSNWRQQEITVDGEQTEWQDTMTFIEKKNVSIGVANDTEFVYVCMTSTDHQLLRQIMATGFTLWFDPEGGKEKTFGIRFPIGMIESGLMMMQRWSRDRDQETNLESMREKFEQSLTKIEVIWPEKNERLRFNNASTLPGIEAKVKLSDAADLLVYEIKVPLVQTEQHRFAIGTEAGKQLGIGFETAELNREELRERMGRGGFGGGRGGGRGGFGGRRGGDRPPRPEQFKLWASVQLDSEGNAPSVQLIPDD